MGWTQAEKDIKRDLQKRFGKERGLLLFDAYAASGKLGPEIQKRHGQMKN